MAYTKHAPTLYIIVIVDLSTCDEQAKNPFAGLNSNGPIQFRFITQPTKNKPASSASGSVLLRGIRNNREVAPCAVGFAPCAVYDTKLTVDDHVCPAVWLHNTHGFLQLMGALESPGDPIGRAQHHTC